MKKKVVISIILLMIVLCFSVISYAAKGSFSASPKSLKINVGKTANISITAKDCGGKFTITSSDSSIVSVKESSKWIESGTDSVTIEGKKAGTATITIEASNVGDTSEDEVTGSKTINITVNDNNSSSGATSGGNTTGGSSSDGGASEGNATGGSSSDGGASGGNATGGSSSDGGASKPVKATLTKVKVGDKTYTKAGFTVQVENDVTSIDVVPTISNGETYTINKSENNKTVKLEEGTNTIKIKLASGNSYTIYVRRAAKEDDTPNIIDEPTLKSLLIKGVTSNDEKIELSYTPEFSSEVYEYKLLLDETLSDIVKLDIQTVAAQEDFKVEVTGNEELKDGENIVTITVKSADGANTVTYKIIVTKEVKEDVEPTATISAPVVEIPQEVVSPRWNNTQKVLITLFTSIIAGMGIMYAVIEYRYTNNKEESYDEEDDFEPYSFGRVGFKKEEDNARTFEDEVEDDVEEQEEVSFEKIEPDNNVNKQYESIDTEFESFESIQEEKPKNNKNKGRHF